MGHLLGAMPLPVVLGDVPQSRGGQRIRRHALSARAENFSADPEPRGQLEVELAPAAQQARPVTFLDAVRDRRRIEVDELPPFERDSTMRAVEGLGGRVTVGDVAAKAGLKITQAERALKALAADTGGFLEVSDDGDVLYCLPKNFRTVLASKSAQLKLEPVFNAIKGGVSYLTRVLFGTTLVASILLVWTAVLLIISSSSREDNNNNNRRSGGYGQGGYYGGSRGFGGPSLYIDPFDFLWFYDPFYSRNRQIRRQEKKKMNFLESVFSFVFGDGDPNETSEERRWQTIGDYITNRGGVVTAEELAPFLDPPPLTESTKDDEAYVVPVLQRFDGVPEVDEQGNILYVFPSLQRTATDWLGRRRVQVDESLPTQGGVFEERLWKFSEAEPGQRALSIALGAANLVGVLILSSLVRDTQMVRSLGSGLVSFMANTLPFFQAYAVSFFAIPLFRWFTVQRTNAKIEARNNARLQRANALSSASAPLRRKLSNARAQADRVVIGSDKIIYSTETDIGEQDLEAAEWERRFQKGGRS